MKKVLKLVLILTLVLALSVTGFAKSSAHERDTNEDTTTTAATAASTTVPAGTTVPVSEAVAASTPVVAASTTADSETTVVVRAATNNAAITSNGTLAETLTKNVGGEVLGYGGNFEVVATKNGQEVHKERGLSVTATIEHPTNIVSLANAGNAVYFNVMEDSEGEKKVAASGPVKGERDTVTLTSFSTFTVVYTDVPLLAATSPATNQNNLTVSLIGMAFLALAGAAIAAKRRSIQQ